MCPARFLNECCGVYVHQDTAMSLTSTTKSPEILKQKGAGFLRRNNNANKGIFATKRKSAVELLEASKAEYVKTSSVLNNRQELKHPEVLHVGTRPKSAVISNQPARPKSEYGLPLETGCVDIENNITVKRKQEDKAENNNSAQRKNSNVSAKSGSVNRDVCNSCESSKINKSENQRLVSPVNSDKTSSSNVEFSANETHKNNHNSSMESKDRPKEKVSGVKSKDFLKPTSYHHLSTSVTVLVEKRCSSPSTEFSNEISVLRRKKKPLHRSQSDLSGRHSRNSSDFSDLSSRLSRTSTELERFFNEMGIDKSVLDPMIKLQKNKDSDVFESVSSVDSAQHDRSSSSDISEHAEKADKPETDKEIAERNTKQTSIVEKNARIIKWLCNVKKARHPNQQAS